MTTFVAQTDIQLSMAKYLILSDIHGSQPALEKALKLFSSEHCDYLCILGDILNYGPRNRVPEGMNAMGIAELLNGMAERVLAIRGNCDSEVDQMLLDFPMMQDFMLIVDEGKRLLLTHGHIYNANHLPKGHFDALFYGHTHLCSLSAEHDMAVCNTGSITFPKENRPATLAIYDSGVIQLLTLDGEVLKKLEI